MTRFSKNDEPPADPPVEVPPATPPAEDAPATASEAALAELNKWADENGHKGADIATLRIYAPHEMLAEYDEAVQAEADAKSVEEAAEKPAEATEEVPPADEGGEA